MQGKLLYYLLDATVARWKVIRAEENPHLRVLRHAATYLLVFKEEYLLVTWRYFEWRRPSNRSRVETESGRQLAERKSLIEIMWLRRRLKRTRPQSLRSGDSN